MTPYIALLRGINLGGHNKVPMKELCELGNELGWQQVRTYIQSGNVVFAADAEPMALEAELEQAIERHFGLSVPVVVRSAKAWSEYVAGNPFPEASREDPKLVLLALSKSPPVRGAEAALAERAAGGERVARAGDALWIHYKSGVGRSKLSPALVDRLVGSPVTMRNLRTVLKLDEMAKEC